MKVHEAEAILKYYADIPQRIEIIRRQCTALSDEVDPMRGMGTDGMPRGGTPGDSTAAMACRMDELGIGDQLRQLEQQRAVLLGRSAYHPGANEQAGQWPQYDFDRVLHQPQKMA